MNTVSIEAAALQNAAPPSIASLRAAKLSMGFKAAYGAGQIVDSLTQVFLNAFFFFYITNVCGLSGTLTGLGMFLALSVDAVADPVIGSMSGNLETRWGRRVPVMAFSLLPVCVSLGLLFSTPHLAGWGLFAYTLALLLALRVSISGFMVPFLGLGAELSDDYDERSSIVAWRAIVGMLATLLGYVLGFGVFLHGTNGLLERHAYSPFGWICAAVMFLTGALSVHASLRELPRMTVTISSQHQFWGRLYLEVREVFRNPSFRLLFGGVLFFFVGQGVGLTLALDGSKYFWGFDANQIQAVALASVAGLALGLPISFALIGRVEKRTVVVAGIIIICLALSLPVLAQLLGLLPAGMFFRVAVQTGAGVINGVMVCVVSISFQSALADAVDEHEHLFGTRREGLYFAALSFAGKAATGVGSLLSGVLLDAIHFPSQAIAAGGAVTIAPQVMGHLGLIAGPAAGLVTAVSVGFFSRYKLNRAAHAVIRREIGR